MVKRTGESVLDDLLARGLKLVVCGTAASSASAARKAYYAGPGNKFWDILSETGLTPRKLEPREFRDLLRFGIGLTDIVKQQFGNDPDIDFGLSCVEPLTRRLLDLQPAYLSFNGKKAAQVLIGRKRIEYGLQEERIGATAMFVAPSTSGAVNGYWDPDIWRELGRRVSAVAA